MIMALRKIEGRGEVPGATSAIMEMCVDNPREGFADLFATHPSITTRVEALVQFADGHDPGPIGLLPVAAQPPLQETAKEDESRPTEGPWGPAAS
jgi:heat shock protein HtpX